MIASGKLVVMLHYRHGDREWALSDVSMVEIGS